MTELEQRIKALEDKLYGHSLTRTFQTKDATFNGHFNLVNRPALPAVCSVGELTFLSGELYECTAADTWSIVHATDSHILGLFTAAGPLTFSGGVYTASYQPQYAADTGSANAYAAAPSPVISAYAAGQTFAIKIANTSTGPSTLNINSKGAVNIKKIDGTVAITKGDLVAGNTYFFTYDGTNFVTQVPRNKANGELHVACNSGNNTITAGFMPRKVRMEWSYPASTSGQTISLGGAGSWLVAGTYAEAGNRNSASSGGSVTVEAWSDNAAIVTGKAASNFGDFSGAIANLSDTGFDLTMSNSTGSTPTVRISWEAES